VNEPRRPEGVPVEVRPEVVFLYELLQDLTRGKLRIPRFQRPFVWRRDQMTDLLDSVHRQYPIGSLLVWETSQEIATLDRLGPFSFPRTSGQVGYLLDGHQRLSTLAGALIPPGDHPAWDEDPDPGRWSLAYNFEHGRFQHAQGRNPDGQIFPLNALLDTLRFFKEADRLRGAYPENPGVADGYISEISAVARSFQHYRVPVIRIRQTEASEAVEIFARLNSKGQAMSADQMVSALMYRDTSGPDGFDLGSKIDDIVRVLSEEYDFGEIDRTTVLRAVLANLGEDIYRTDWTRLTTARRSEMMPRMAAAAERAEASLVLAVRFLQSEVGVATARLLPYAMQLVLLSAFLDVRPRPSSEQLSLLRQWFWVSSFSGWFGSANPSRINSLVTEFRNSLATQGRLSPLSVFDMAAEALPYPTSFDMRSARTRALLLVLLSLRPRSEDGLEIEEPWRLIASRGPEAIGHVIPDPPRRLAGNPANRMLRPAHVLGSLRQWIVQMTQAQRWDVLASHGITQGAAFALAVGDLDEFMQERTNHLINSERRFQQQVGVRAAARREAASPVDTE